MHRSRGLPWTKPLTGLFLAAALLIQEVALSHHPFSVPPSCADCEGASSRVERPARGASPVLHPPRGHGHDPSRCEICRFLAVFACTDCTPVDFPCVDGVAVGRLLPPTSLFSPRAPSGSAPSRAPPPFPTA